MGKMDGRVVIVTGAARGQGEQEARLFAAEGADVVLTDVLDVRGEDLAGELGARYRRLDVRREDDWRRVVEETARDHGRVDGLVNNAGVLRFGRLVDTSAAEFAEVMEVNQVGCFLGIRTVAPVLADGGTIVNTASCTALTGMAAVGAYTASKHAVLGLTRVAALELAPRGIRVNAVCPGAVDTPMVDPGGAPSAERDAHYRRLVPLGRMGRAEEVARLALFLSCEDSSYITGQPFVIDGGWLAGVRTG